MPSAQQDHRGEILDPAECRRLLGTVHVGRLAFTSGAMPTIEPVWFRLHGDAVAIPAVPGTPMVSGARGAVVAFQVDCLHDRLPTAWSITVVGPSRVVCDPAETQELDGLDWPACARSTERCYVLVAMGRVKGWRTEPVAQDDGVGPRLIGTGHSSSLARPAR
ncbi:MAG TPA: pyridoxamine 5'-phosphate oxidase family protein [Geodermatophilus sp.]|nr:pyridoxamine 5'-phosphate oxidase family protein [Geodermatophilus sp.]